MRGPITLDEKLWARALNQRLLSYGCCAVFFKTDTKIKFIGNMHVPQHLWEQLESAGRRNVFATYLWNEVMKGTEP